MSQTTERDTSHFFLRRIIRIGPAYWMMTLVLVFLFGGFSWYSPRDVALDCFFIPHISAHGGIYPTLAVGWTLNIEMYFYLLLAVSLRLSQAHASLLAGVFIVLISMAIGGLSENTVLQTYYAGEYIYCFVIGIALYHVHRFLAPKLHGLSVPAATLWAAIALTTIAIVFISDDHTFLLVYLLPTLLAGTALFQFAAGRDIAPRFASTLGDASYLIYLCHTIILEWLRQSYGIVLSDNLPGVILYLVGVTALSIAMHKLLEKPILISAKRLLSRSEAAPLYS